jgi:hypothetical protein
MVDRPSAEQVGAGGVHVTPRQASPATRALFERLKFPAASFTLTAK